MKNLRYFLMLVSLFFMVPLICGEGEKKEKLRGQLAGLEYAEFQDLAAKLSAQAAVLLETAQQLQARAGEAALGAGANVLLEDIYDEDDDADEDEEAEDEE